MPYPALVPAFIICGIGMSLFFAPVANVILGSVRREEEGLASGANNAIRELGGVLGIAVLGAVFSARGGYATGHAFVAGLTPALCAGAAGVAAATAALLPLLATAPARSADAPARLAHAPEQADPQQTERNPRPAAHAIVIGDTS